MKALFSSGPLAQPFGALAVIWHADYQSSGSITGFRPLGPQRDAKPSAARAIFYMQLLHEFKLTYRRFQSSGGAESLFQLHLCVIATHSRRRAECIQTHSHTLEGGARIIKTFAFDAYVW